MLEIINFLLCCLILTSLLLFIYRQKNKSNGIDTQSLKEFMATNFADGKASVRERFDYLDKSFSELNKLFASSKRGLLGNFYLNELLGNILPKGKNTYQLEFTLKKTGEKGEKLRVDAIVFGPEQKNNLAIESKFPLDNYQL